MKNCTECGSQLEDDWKLCPHCGGKVGKGTAGGTVSPVSQDVFVSSRAGACDITQVSGSESTAGSAGFYPQDIFIGPRSTTGAITQIQNLNIESMSEEQFHEICGKLNLLLKQAGIPRTTKTRKKMTITREQNEIAAAIKEKLSRAEQHFHKSIGDPEIFIRLGAIEELTGDLEMAMEFYIKALELFLHKGDESGVAHCYNLIGLVHFHLREYDDAFGNFQKALRTAEQRDDTTNMAMSLNNIAKLYFVRSEYEKALRISLKALRFKLKARKDRKRREKQTR